MKLTGPPSAAIWPHRRFILDGRNALDAMAMRAAGFEYVGVGRASASKDAGFGWRRVTCTENTECQC